MTKPRPGGSTFNRCQGVNFQPVLTHATVAAFRLAGLVTLAGPVGGPWAAQNGARRWDMLLFDWLDPLHTEEGHRFDPESANLPKPFRSLMWWTVGGRLGYRYSD